MGREHWGRPQLKQDHSHKYASIRLSPNDQNLEIEFLSLDFHNLEQIRYAYLMVEDRQRLDLTLNDRKNLQPSTTD